MRRRRFVLLSGFLARFSVEKLDTLKKLLLYILKRYLRFSLLAMCGGVITLCLYQIIGFHNQEIGILLQNGMGDKMAVSPTISGVLKFSFIDLWLYGECEYDPPMWMMQLLFFGTIITAVVSYALTKIKGGADIFLWFLAGTVFSSISPYLGEIMIGYLISRWDLSVFWNSHKNKRIWFNYLSIILWVISVMGFGFYRRSSYSKIIQVYFVLSTVMVVLAYISEFLHKILSISLLSLPGKYSAEIFIVHYPVICSFSAWFYLFLTDKAIYGFRTYIFTFLITTGLIVILCLLLHFIYTRMNILLDRLIRHFKRWNEMKSA